MLSASLNKTFLSFLPSVQTTQGFSLSAFHQITKISVTRANPGGVGGWCNGMFMPPPPPPHTLLTPHFYFPLELYVYITLTNNNLAFFIYQLFILWTITTGVGSGGARGACAPPLFPHIFIFHLNYTFK